MNKLSQSTEHAPVILFAYNRVNVLKKTIQALSRNLEIEKTDLLIFSDGPKNDDDKDKVSKVREYINSLDKFTKSITYHEHKTNIGLAQSIIFGITKVSKQYKNFIVLEDDLVTSKYFLKYMNESLARFETNPKVWAINGMGINKNLLKFSNSYLYNTYFTYRSSSHGWGSWSNKWSQAIWENNQIKKEIFKFKNNRNFLKGGRDLSEILIQQLNKKNDSWWIKWNYTISKNKGVCLAPKYSYVSAQVDSDGTHIRVYMKILDNDLSQSQQDISFPDSEDVNSEIAKQLSSIFVSKYASNIKTPKIFSKNKNIFISYFEYIEFIIKYIEAKYTIKSKIHRIKGFIKYQLGRK